MTTAGTLERGRAAFEVSAWMEAYDCLAAADAEASLAPADIELFASAAFLIGRDDESSALWARAHRAHLDRGDVEQAAGSAAWLAFGLLTRGEMVQAGSWIMRAVKLLDDGQRECVQVGYLVLLSGMRAMFAGDDEAAMPQIDQAVAIADRFGDPDLRMLARTGRGQALLAQGRIDEGIELLDEVMVAATSGEVSATVAGLTYCAVISACHDVFDVRRAQEWSAALTHWCDDQPDLVPYTGWCQVHRAEIMELRGTWLEALDAATRAYERSLLSTDQATGGAARYLLGDVHRLRGNLELAEEAYREANRLGNEPQPGLALLRLAQGQPTRPPRPSGGSSTSAPSRRRGPGCSRRTSRSCWPRGRSPAQTAVDELDQVAALFRSPFLAASAAQWAGAVRLADGDAGAALPLLRRGWAGWRDLDVPYEAARCRVAIGLACRALGDEDAAQMELDAARWAFAQLAAEQDLARVEALVDPASSNAGTPARPASPPARWRCCGWWRPAGPTGPSRRTCS